MGIRAQAEADLSKTLEDLNGYGLPVILINPDGEEETVSGQVLYDSVTTDIDGEQLVVNKPVVTLRRSSLSQIPLETDTPRWMCRIPTTPISGASTETYIVEQASEGGRSIGFIRLYLTKVVQS